MPAESDLLNTLQNFTAKVGGVLKQEKDTNYFHNHESYQVNYNYHQSKIMLTVYLQLIPERGRGPNLTRYTRIEIPFDNSKKTYIKLTRATGLSKLANIFSASKVKTGNDVFDSQFLLSGKPAELVKSIFQKQYIYQAVTEFNDLYLTISDQPTNPDLILQPHQSILEININYVIKNENDLMKLNKLATDIIDSIS